MAQKVVRITPFNVTALALGLAFLYLPIVILVIYSCNASRLVTVWGGWSLRWYTEFFNDRAMLEAAWMSLRVAAVSATIATLLGTLAAVALSRGERFKGRTLFSGMLYAPLAMPEVITGLSLLLLFVGLNAERWCVTATRAYTDSTLVFALSLDDVVIASFTTGPGSATLPIRIYSEVRLGVKPEINAICTLVIALIAVVIVIASLASKLTSGRGESAAPL